MTDPSLDSPATIRDVAFATALAMVTSIRASSANDHDSQSSLAIVVESLDIAATSEQGEIGVSSVLTAIAQFMVVLSAKLRCPCVADGGYKTDADGPPQGV